MKISETGLCAFAIFSLLCSVIALVLSSVYLSKTLAAEEENLTLRARIEELEKGETPAGHQIRLNNLESLANALDYQVSGFDVQVATHERLIVTHASQISSLETSVTTLDSSVATHVGQTSSQDSSGVTLDGPGIIIKKDFFYVNLTDISVEKNKRKCMETFAVEKGETLHFLANLSTAQGG